MAGALFLSDAPAIFTFLEHRVDSVSLLSQDSVFIDVARLFALYSF